MKIEHINALVLKYSADLIDIESRRIDPHHTLADCTRVQILSHARYLLELLKRDVSPSNQYGKANRKLGEVQTCLSFAGVYTLADIRSHNKGAR